MRILQLIDSLEAGGAERMAVNYANTLAEQIEFSGLVSTRKQGPLHQQLSSTVSYLLLNKKSTFDLKALWRLRKYIRIHKVEWVHVHSTSFFMGFLLKFFCPSVKLIWHDHYGDSEFLATRSRWVYKLGLPFYEGIISVNQKLKDWSIQCLHFRNGIYLPNFSAETQPILATTNLKGLEGKRILALANLRPQKNHLLLLQIAKRIKISHPDWTFHLVGKDFGDTYSQQIKDTIITHGLQQTVYVYGSKNDVQNILSQSTIGILTSASEGLPLALLEYGMAKVPVVVTNVGEIPAVIENDSNGYLVPVDEQLFYEKLVNLIVDEQKQAIFAERLAITMENKFGENSIIQSYLKWISGDCK